MEQKYIIWFAIIMALILGIAIGMMIAQRTITCHQIVSCANSSGLTQLRNLSVGIKP